MFIARPASRLMTAARCAVVTVLLATAMTYGVADAHPVAQGALLASVEPTKVRVTATVSAEEISIGTLDVARDNLSEATRIERYGAYLLQHLLIIADGRRLAGRVVRTASELRERTELQLEYAIPNPEPRELQFRQNALREILFAPGNPWEARYLLKLDAFGQESEPVLLPPETTVAARCDWRGPATCAIGSDEKGVGHALFFEGVRHILTGYDHLLFVAALLLAVGSLWELVKVISVFTLAHTITLSLATFGIVRMSPSLVEPVIAASIVAVAMQNLLWPRQSRGVARLAIAFVFGLFHGLGFAQGLVDAMATLSVDNVLWALAAFSLGVEVGHQIVVLPALAALRASRRYFKHVPVDMMAMRAGSLLIGVSGLCYFVLAVAG
jgi:hydrogenase/urease accessory protein HupE